MRDKQGRTYARLRDLQAGDFVVVDGDFPCLKPWTRHQVRQHVDGRLFVECSTRVRHFLDGQSSERSDYLIGIYPDGTSENV